MTTQHGSARRALTITTAVALALVVLAPVALSSQHIYAWARAPLGLGLSVPFAILAFVALDLAATVCVSMTIYAGLRGEGAGIFGILTWVFAAGSAWINYQASESTPSPLDGPFFAAMSIAGPVLLEATLAKIRRWTRQADGTQTSARPKFGNRWIVAPGETLRAWAAARRENIARPDAAIAYVRERAALADMADVDAIRYAWAALGTYDEYSARLWLQARGRNVSQAAVVEATADRPRTPLADKTPARPLDPGPTPDGGSPAALPAGEEHAADRAALAALPSKRDKIRHAFAAVGSYDAGPVSAWLSARGVEVTRSEVYATRKADQERKRVTQLRVAP